MKDLVLVATWCVNDDWYGKRYRVILTESTEGNFIRKGDAKKFAAKLKKYVKQVHSISPKELTITCDERDQFPSYTYNSFGPSLSFTHFDITTEQLVEQLLSSQ